MSEQFIPLHHAELAERLADEADLTEAEQADFRQLHRYLGAACKLESSLLLEKLKEAYAPFDPDGELVPLHRPTSDERQERLNSLFAQFGCLMDRADYRHLSRTEIEPALGTSTAWGLVMDVDFHIFERLAVFARGDSTEPRKLRRLRGLYREEQREVPIYQRLALIMKLRPHHRLARHIDTERVYLQIFKNIPKLDLSMAMPGARVRLTKIDRSKISFPIVSGLALALYNIATDVFTAFVNALGSPALVLWALATGAFGYGTRSYFNYLSTRQRYNLNLTQVLYFQNLDSNAGALFRVLDEAEEQQCRELLLAYFFLWRHAAQEAWTRDQLGQAIDTRLQEWTELALHFEPANVLARLEKYGMVEQRADRYRALPIHRCLEALPQHCSTALESARNDRWAQLLQKKSVADFTI